MSKDKNTKEKKILIEAWRARIFLKVHGFLPDSENTKIRKRLVSYQSKHDIKVTEKEIIG